MPFVSVKLAGDEPTAEQKVEIIEGITDLLYTVLGKSKSNTMVTIEAIPTDNWGFGGETITSRRKKGL